MNQRPNHTRSQSNAMDTFGINVQTIMDADLALTALPPQRPRDAMHRPSPAAAAAAAGAPPSLSSQQRQSAAKADAKKLLGSDGKLPAFVRGKRQPKQTERFEFRYGTAQTNGLVKHNVKEVLADADNLLTLDKVKELFDEFMDPEAPWGENMKPFAAPVDTSTAPGYEEVIEEPMDFGTIMDDLENGEYRTVSAVLRDIEKVFKNCKAYNTLPSMTIRAQCAAVEKVYYRLLTEKALRRKKRSRTAPSPNPPAYARVSMKFRRVDPTDDVVVLDGQTPEGDDAVEAASATSGSSPVLPLNPRPSPSLPASTPSTILTPPSWAVPSAPAAADDDDHVPNGMVKTIVAFNEFPDERVKEDVWLSLQLVLRQRDRKLIDPDVREVVNKVIKNYTMLLMGTHYLKPEVPTEEDLFADMRGEIVKYVETLKRGPAGL